MPSWLLHAHTKFHMTRIFSWKLALSEINFLIFFRFTRKNQTVAITARFWQQRRTLNGMAGLLMRSFRANISMIANTRFWCLFRVQIFTKSFTSVDYLLLLTGRRQTHRDARENRFHRAAWYLRVHHQRWGLPGYGTYWQSLRLFFVLVKIAQKSSFKLCTWFFSAWSTKVSSLTATISVPPLRDAVMASRSEHFLHVFKLNLIA